ncbi:uncharacterized protein EDB93DRAFT_1109613 [Suillus bovinus]|uniref:uncharacterized protein n=1 Tax=Suillus bovinus TaxID=48563 RepID=UPI001B878ADF|nr:uncharacterized protein EDB93DRAFT_1109613 [Suillus bovinus]KAG2126568.1 hypothetical protein EDB93DRAFT_1109613 [Suillus bovinus]
MRPKYETEEERHEARLKSKKESYARGAAVHLDSLWSSLGYHSSTLQCKFLESYGMSIVTEVDREGWDSVKPGCEAGFAEVKHVLQQAYDLRIEACDVKGPLTDQL